MMIKLGTIHKFSELTKISIYGKKRKYQKNIFKMKIKVKIEYRR